MTIDEYILSHSDEEGALLSALNRDANVNLLRPRMLSGHLQGRILKMFCRMLRPRRVLEIGTYTGYATLCMAEGLEEGALIHTLEINDEMEDFIMKYLKQSPHQDKIRVISAMPSILSRHSVKPSTLFLSMPTSGCIRNISTLFSRWCVPAA